MQKPEDKNIKKNLNTDKKSKADQKVSDRTQKNLNINTIKKSQGSSTDRSTNKKKTGANKKNIKKVINQNQNKLEEEMPLPEPKPIDPVQSKKIK